MDAFARKSFDESGAQFAWDGTSIELAQTCPRKYYYRMIANVVPTGNSVHLLFGGIYASALEFFYHRRAEGSSIDEALRLSIRHALILAWDPATSQYRDFNHSSKTLPNLIRTIVWYVDQFGDEEESAIKTHHLSDGRPAVELSFALELTDDFLYCGHLDRVVTFNDGKFWMDQKTTGSTVSASFFDGFKPSNQFLGYTWAGQVVLDSPMRGGIIDAAQIAVGFSRFERAPITFTQDQLIEWKENTIWTIEHMRRLTHEERFPMNLSSCGNYGGCPYRELCSRTPSVRSAFIAGDFRHPESAWDPLTPR